MVRNNPLLLFTRFNEEIGDTYGRLFFSTQSCSFTAFKLLLWLNQPALSAAVMASLPISGEGALACEIHQAQQTEAFHYTGISYSLAGRTYDKSIGYYKDPVMRTDPTAGDDADLFSRPSIG